MADAINTNGLTWRTLNKEGCELGRGLTREMEQMQETVDGLKSKLDKLTWALVSAAIGFGTAALMLALNLLV